MEAAVIDTEERDAVLQLSKRFSDNWVILDVGANKGEWSDTLIQERDSSVHARKYTIHLFEPNALLLNYTRVKYDRNKHIVFCDSAVSRSNNKAVPFCYFTNENSGLSSLYHNPKWDYLPMQTGEVATVTLDTYLTMNGIADVDIVKVDVEGADYDVLLGCRRALLERRIKFLQVEYSPHYQAAGVTFKEVMAYMASLGYSAWAWKPTEGVRAPGEFEKVSAEDFVEDFTLRNFYFTYEEIGRHHYTQLWNGEFQKSAKLIPRCKFALEIGCFEGLTTNYICDNLLLPGGRIICVDPLEDFYLAEGSDKQTNDMFIGQHARFLRNTLHQPVELIRKISRDAWPQLKDYLFDLIYIDGDHREQAVYEDGCNSLSVLKHGGFMLFDDYEWSDGTKRGIDRFLNEHAELVKIVQIGYQVLLTKK